jgi:hypothetical protein
MGLEYKPLPGVGLPAPKTPARKSEPLGLGMLKANVSAGSTAGKLRDRESRRDAALKDAGV